MKESKYSYYITCLMSGMVELGTVFLGITLHFNLTLIIGLAMAYQLGNILRFFVTEKIAKYQTLFSAITLLLSLIVLFTPDMEMVQFSTACIMLILFSTILQNIRSAVQGNIPRWKKRSCRVLGFILSSIVYSLGPVSLVAASLILLFYSMSLEHFYYDNWYINWKAGNYGRKICWAMVTHQAHYFAYNYIMLFLTVTYFKNPYISAMWFAANWIPYTITEPLVQKLKWDKWFTIAIGAHVFNAVVLISMYCTLDLSFHTSLCLWVLTGFGGGNVFCIKKALAPVIVYDKNVWSFSEQIGHILGVFVALIIAFIGIPEKSSLLAAVFFALATIPIIMYTYRRNK